MLGALLSLIPLLGNVQAYFIMSQRILEITRLDPVVSPGQISSHVHIISGGSNFADSMTYASTQAGKCTTAPVSVDKSNYWIPMLYYYSPSNQSYQAIPASFMNAYYLPRPGKSGIVQAFPDGLRMISGNPNRRTFDPTSPADLAITFVCLDYSGQHTNDPDWAQRNSFFDHNCPQGMRAQVNFPNCWDGINLDSSDHSSHMAWPSGGVDGGDCPDSHPVHLVSLFYEFIFNVQNFPFNPTPNPTWVFANGDTTGYGLHADFINGWPTLVNGTNILQQAINDCNDDNGVGGELSNCPPFVPFLNQDSASACQPQNPLVDEDVGMGHYISKLPGNNPIWIGNGTKPSIPGYKENSTLTNVTSSLPGGWSSVGCIAESTTGRALSAKSLSSSNMTGEVCVSWCSSFGFPLAGVEYGDECYCDTAMRNGASNTTLLDSDQCNMQCPGNTYENCGGPNRLNLYVNPSLFTSPSLPTGWSYTGCKTEATTGRALSSYSFSSESMTPTLCIQACLARNYTSAGVEYSRECYCGNVYNQGSINTTEGGCNMACSGDSLYTCGGSSRLSTYSFTNTSTPSTNTTSPNNTTSPTNTST
ncbi:hypothetical protein TREMEDRAFT_24256, partial [Tremella mesenterica DSM 1558]|uniref:uncharacterized protein n=1 Tax=Tremella mesenterica (strain ATCC 24925 / CBS 8224 / DSM 1558 / NBRC 9311 / NRRL Y-6157 / RJB 2259-6 / UBC 559-6) TaxID=578456 RepID=UPI0003F49BB7